jgi:hypothetical protein
MHFRAILEIVEERNRFGKMWFENFPSSKTSGKNVFLCTSMRRFRIRRPFSISSDFIFSKFSLFEKKKQKKKFFCNVDLRPNPSSVFEILTFWKKNKKKKNFFNVDFRSHAHLNRDILDASSKSTFLLSFRDTCESFAFPPKSFCTTHTNSHSASTSRPRNA